MSVDQRPVAPAAPQGGERLDRFGALASSLCAVHCAVSALLPAAFGALGLGFLLGQGAEWAFTLIAIVFAGGALVLGWRRHRSALVAGVLVLGMVGLLASRGIELSGGHHDHHDQPHHSAAERAGAAHQGDEHGHGHGHGHEHEHEHEHDHAAATPRHVGSAVAPAHEDSAHLIGTAVGVLAGLLLLLGHVLNIRASRRCRDEACCA